MKTENYLKLLFAIEANDGPGLNSMCVPIDEWEHLLFKYFDSVHGWDRVQVSRTLARFFKLCVRDRVSRRIVLYRSTHEFNTYKFISSGYYYSTLHYSYFKTRDDAVRYADAVL
jgi:hypothetical protein